MALVRITARQAHSLAGKRVKSWYIDEAYEFYTDKECVDMYKKMRGGGTLWQRSWPVLKSKRPEARRIFRGKSRIR